MLPLSPKTGAQEFAEARELQWMWKTPAMGAMAVMICRLALERGAQGEFSANDLPAHKAAQHGGSGIAGSIFKRLASDEVLCPVGLFVDGKFMQKVTFNAGGNRIGVWRLLNAARAQRLIRVHTAREDVGENLEQADLPAS